MRPAKDQKTMCVQRTQHLNFRRRLKGSKDKSCWEPYTMTSNTGCDCMWPDSIGDIYEYNRRYYWDE